MLGKRDVFKKEHELFQQGQRQGKRGLKLLKEKKSFS